MCYPKATVRQSDLTRYFKAMKAAGFQDFKVEIKPSGRVLLSTQGPISNHQNPCDRLLD